MVTGRPGPVVLDVPFDIFKEAAAKETPKPEDWNSGISCRCGADPDGVARALDMLLAAKRPVILVGQGVKYAGAPRVAPACRAVAHPSGLVGERHRRH